MTHDDELKKALTAEQDTQYNEKQGGKKIQEFNKSGSLHSGVSVN